MKYYYTLIIPLLLISVSYSQHDNYIRGDLIVQFKPGSEPSNIISSYESIGLAEKRLLSKRMNIWLLQYDINLIADEDALFDIKGNPHVKEAQFNHIVQQRTNIDFIPYNNEPGDAFSNIFPNDPRFNEQWALHNTGQSGGTPGADIKAPAAWELTTGGYTALNATIVIAIVDGGCNLNHSDLNYWFNTLEIPNNNIDDENNGYIDDYRGWNAYQNNGNVPSNSHGTHVSGIAGAKGNNGLGVAGINWDARIMPIAGSSSNEATVIAAYGYVLEMRSLYNETNGQKGAFVVVTNASFGVDYGQPSNYPLWCAIYDSLGMQGVLSCGATANLNINIDLTGDVPTACPSPWLISVTNTTRNDVKNTNAAYGLTTIDLGAPGTSILSTDVNNNYTLKTGTSMASPTVAGVVALMFAAANADFMEAYKLNPSEYALIVKEHLLNGVDPIPSLQGITVTGGRLNAHNAVVNISQHVIPVELASFTAEATTNGILLNWITSTETNNLGFEVERIASVDKNNNGSWQTLAFINGKGNTAERSYYSFTDHLTQAGNYFYRLKQIDFDGTSEYIAEIQTEFVVPGYFNLAQNYPNPFNPETVIEYTLPENANVNITVYNALGETVRVLENGFVNAGIKQLGFDATDLPSGTYIYRIIAAGEQNTFTASRKMMLVK